MSDLFDLPPDWSYSNLEGVARSIGGGTPSKSDPTFWTDGTIPWVSPKDMKTFNVTSSEDTLAVKALDRLSLIPTESVLVVVRSGILSRTLPVGLNMLPVTINQDMRAFVPESGVSAKYLAWQLMAKEREVLSKCTKDGTTVASIEGPSLARFPLAIAPAVQQTRIVAKLEELLSDFDAGVAELKAAQQKLIQYRQSLLKAAVEGVLTAAWRQHNQPGETGTQLLQRILTERRARWEARQLAKFQAQGKTPPKDWQKKYPEPVPPDTTDLPELPDGWAWASVDQVGEVFLGKMLDKTKHVTGTKLPYLRNINVRWGTVDFSDLLEMFFEDDELDRYGLVSGDVLVCEGGEPGRSAVYRGEFAQMKYQKALHRVRFFGLFEPELLVIFLEYAAKNGKLEKSFTGSTIKHFTKESFLQLAIPLPSQEEQHEIVQAISQSFEVIFEQEQAINLSLKQSTAQRQNILRAAFSGQLVPQDPKDEPASVLLERIRAERAAQVAVKKPRGRKVKEAPHA